MNHPASAVVQSTAARSRREPRPVSGISLVMATLGRVEEVRQSVDALIGQTCRSFELIVVDQNPDDRLVPVLKRAIDAGIAVRHLRQSTPGLCLARNAGLAVASMDIVAFPDDDCWYEPDTLERVIDCMSGTGAPDGLLIRWAEQDPQGHPAHALSASRWWAFREVPASSISQFLRRELVQSLGGFDTELGLNGLFGGAEETDLMFRVLGSGAVVHYSPEPLVHHPVHAAVHGGLIAPDWRSACRAARKRSRGTGALYAKHRVSAYVVLRGFVSPLLRPLWRMQGWGTVAQGICTAFGRVEGYCRWRFKAA